MRLTAAGEEFVFEACLSLDFFVIKRERAVTLICKGSCMIKFVSEYLKHSVLNFGQVLQSIQYFYSHPDADKLASRGSVQHFKKSVALRGKLIANDLMFTLIPPHWHHSKDEISALHSQPIKTWFLCGYSPWRFADDKGNLRTLTGNEDRRWDPRCKE